MPFPFPMTSSRTLSLLSLIATLTAPAFAHQATGIKLTEPTTDSITVWTRLSRDAERAPDDGPLPTTKLFDRTTGKEVPLKDNATYSRARPEVTFPPGANLGSIRGAAVGAPGQTRVRYRPAGTPTSRWTETTWRDVDPHQDFTATFALTQLTPGTRYEVAVDDRPRADAPVTSTTTGGFVTAPLASANAAATFAVMSCQQYEDRDRPDGFAIYPSMLALTPDFMVNTGDAVYYDHGPVHAVNVDLARYHWARMYGFPTLRDFHRQVASFFMKDDHDTLTNDSHPEDRSADLTFSEGLRVFREQTAPSEPPYRTQRWGRHLQVWFLEGRDYRSPSAQDRTQTPTILGPEQIAWLERTLAASDATFRVVITPTPMVGPDRAQKDDNYANKSYVVEGTKIRALLGRQPNLTVITGDRHWQYVSRDPATKIEEWSVGAATDSHAGGWNEETPRPEHRFLRIKFGGFLSGSVAPSTATAPAALTLRLHDTAGKIVFESTRPAGQKTDTPAAPAR
jgi:alkaline phosphatase D